LLCVIYGTTRLPVKLTSPIANEKSQLDILMEAAGDAVFRLDDKGTIAYISAPAVDLIQVDETLVGHRFMDIIAKSDAAAVSAALIQSRNQCSGRVKARVYTLKGMLWFDMQVTGYLNEAGAVETLVVGHNVSEQHATEERLRHLATHDALTGLPNRSLLADRLRMATAQACRSGRGFTVLVLDLDGFKKINDALGHAIGDTLLRIASNRLRSALRDVDTLARVGGDEFVVLLSGAVEESEIQTVARRIITAIQLPFEIEENLLYVSVSIGAATYPKHGESEVTLLAHADTAMYRAKDTGKSRCVVYSPEKFNQPEHDLSLEAAMFEAIRNGEFLLHYQPVINAQTHEIVGFEALMRWMHPELGLVSPMQFIPMAENNGLINLLGAWALKSACAQTRYFCEAAGRPLHISVNVSPRQFRNEQFLDIVDDAIALSGLESKLLVLEITEGILMSDPEHAEGLLKQINARGVQIAIDDFGTGYSSLAYLKKFPINSLKIDRAFIKDLPESLKDDAICNVILSLAKHLNLSTVAEGVENQEQFDFLARHKCDLIQGYFSGRPQRPEEAVALLKNSAKAAA
jgi:diguanylate cyclase (GGDEF)-like protein